MLTLMLMQGVPGSGKSTLAKALAKRRGYVVCSTDDFHILPDGQWKFDPERLVEFHQWNQFEVEYHLMQGRSVIVDNTNIKQVYAQPYIDLARKYGAEVVVKRMELRFKSVHDVPLEIVERMRAEMENLSV